MHLMNGSQSINANDTKQVDIIVDDIYYFRVPRENLLVVVANSTKYFFTSRATFDDYSVSQLYNAISKGDRLSLIYYESDSIAFEKINVVVGARSEAQIYRTLEAYNQGKKGVPAVVIIIMSIIELVFAGIVFIYIWLNYHMIKGICGKIKK